MGEWYVQGRRLLVVNYSILLVLMIRRMKTELVFARMED